MGRFWHFLELLRPPSFSPRVVFTTCRGHEEMTEGKNKQTWKHETLLFKSRKATSAMCQGTRDPGLQEQGAAIPESCPPHRVVFL